MKKIILVILLLSCNKIAKNIDFRNKDINEFLILAIINKETNRVKELIEAGANVNYIHNNRSILELSLYKESLDIVKVLLEKDAKLNKDNIVRIYDLSLEDFRYDVIDLIKDKYKLEEGLIDNNKYFLLLCYISNEEEVKRFIEKNKINPRDVRDKFSRNGLIISANSNNMEVFRMLVENYKCDINHKNKNGVTPLITASNVNNKSLMEFIIEKGGKVDDKDDKEWTALMISTLKGYKEIVKLLLEKGSNINNKENYGHTALTIASQNGHKEIVKLLIEKGANVDDKEGKGWTALMLASQNGYKEIVELLLEKGANIDNKENDGYTALMIASEEGYKEIVELLLEKGANIDDKEGKGWTSLMLASQNDHKDTVKLLLKKGSNISNKKNDGYTALMIALKRGSLETLKLLIERGSNIYDENFSFREIFIHIGESLKNCKEKSKKNNLIEISYIIIKKMSEDYINLFISLNKNNANQEIKDEVHNYINILYCLQNLPIELFEEVIKKF